MGEHGVPCASYVKRATDAAANGRTGLSGPAPQYADEAASRPMAGAGGGHGERSRFPLCDSGESAAAAAAANDPEGYTLLSAAAAAGSADRARIVRPTG